MARAETEKPSCKDVIQACDATIAKKNEALRVSDLAIKEAQTQIGSLTTQINDKNEQLSAFYRNPAIMIGLGLLTGGLAVALLKH